MKLEELGINADVGGVCMVMSATITENRSYEGKGGGTRYCTDVVYFGGNDTIFTEPDHPIRSKGEGEQVALAIPMIKNQYGWKATGKPRIILAEQTRTQTPKSS